MDIGEIRSEISRLENSDTNYKNCEKLSTLYIVRSGLETEEKPRFRHSHSFASSSEFLAAISDVPVEDWVGVIDEHLESVRALFPKEYAAVIRKINANKEET